MLGFIAHPDFRSDVSASLFLSCYLTLADFNLPHVFVAFIKTHSDRRPNVLPPIDTTNNHQLSLFLDAMSLFRFMSFLYQIKRAILTWGKFWQCIDNVHFPNHSAMELPCKVCWLKIIVIKLLYLHNAHVTTADVINTIREL